MSKTKFLLRGKTALVTGSSRGLGAAIARVLAAQGARVVLNYNQNKEGGEVVLRSIVDAGGDAQLIHGDVMSREGCAELIAKAEACFGSLDILVNNATPPQRMAPISDYAEEDYRSMLDAFVMGPFHLAQLVLPGMVENEWGRIVNITSEVIDNGVTEYSAYVSAKAGQAAWSQCVAREVAAKGVTINNVAPGWIPVERHAGESIEAMEAYIDRVPAGYMGSPEDVAHAVAFFASDEAGFISGQSLAVNGANTVG